MTSKEDYYVFKIYNNLYPYMYRKSILKKYGVKNFLTNVLCHLSEYNYSDIKLVNYAYKLSPDEFNEFISNYQYDGFLSPVIRILLKCKYINVFAKYFSNDIKNKILNDSSVELNKLIPYLEDYIIPIIENDIKNNDYYKYFQHTNNENLVKLIADRLTIDQIMSIFSKEKCFFVTTLISYKKEIIRKYLEDKYNNDDNFLNIFMEYNTFSEHEYILKNINFTEAEIESIIINNIGNYNFCNYLMQKYSKEIHNIIDKCLQLCDYETLTQILKIPNGKESVLNRLNKEIIIKIFKTNITLRNYFIHDLLKLCDKEIVEYIVDEYNCDNNIIYQYYECLDSLNILKKVYENIEVSDETIKNDILSNFSKYFNLYISVKEKQTIQVLNEIRQEDSLFFKDKFKYFEKEIPKKLLEDLSIKEALYILINTYVSSYIKTQVFLYYKDSVIDYIKNKATNDELNIIFKHQPHDEFRLALLEELSIYNIIKYTIYYPSEIETLYNKRTEEFNKYIDDQYIIDKNNLFETSVLFQSYGYDKIANYVLEKYSDEDILEGLINDKIWKNINKQSEVFLKRVKKIIIKYSNYLLNNDFDKYVLLLKCLRTLNDEYSSLSFDTIYINDEILYKLYSERGLSDKQKEILYDKHKYRINELIKTLEEDKLIELLQKGTNDEIVNQIVEKCESNKIIQLLNDKNFIKRRSIGEKFALRLAYKMVDTKDNNEYLKKIVNIYIHNKINLIINYNKINNFLLDLHINSDDFFQVMLNNSYDFINDMVNINDNHKTEFILFYNKIAESKLLKMNDYETLLLLIKNFMRYEKLCISIINTNETLEDAIFLFNRDETLENKPENISECQNINTLIYNNMKNIYEKCKSIDDYKDLICFALFNKNYSTMYKSNQMYGGLKSLIELKHYNNKNIEVLNKIEDLETYAAVIEDIIMCYDIDAIKEVSLNIINNISYIIRDNNLTNYFEKIRELYALELSSNLTKIKSNQSIESVINKELTHLYNVPTYDVSDKKYAVLAHVISDNETVEDLVKGKTSGNSNFISFSAISHRKQCYYYGAKNIIFGYDEMPIENYRYGSKDNLGSNGAISKNSLEIDNSSIQVVQRGLYEISDTNGNSEILAFRKNLMPKYIIIPGKREATKEEIEIARKYNLKFLLTQPKNVGIKNPKDILGLKKESHIEYKKDELKTILNDLLLLKGKKPNRIAILTDAHGLLEPTVAALEDIRKFGITKIYSLGDNIGTGPNPSSVIDLFNMYNVKSVKGNHENYLINGTNMYLDHLKRTNAYEEETVNSLWNKDNLRKDQIETINNYPEEITIMIGNKKILLTHYIYDLNNGALKYNINDYDYIFMGHKHFESLDGNIYTLKALGIGNDSITTEGLATYIIIEETDEGISIIKRAVSFDIANTLNEINITENNTRDKMKEWVRKR